MFILSLTGKATDGDKLDVFYPLRGLKGQEMMSGRRDLVGYVKLYNIGIRKKI